MKKLRGGLVGFGFIGPHHLEAIRRMGLADVTTIATSSVAGTRAKAEQFGIAKSTRDPSLLDRSVRHYAALPGGHAEAWPDALRNLMRNILEFIADQRDPREADELSFPTFATGLRIARIVDAIAASARAGGKWKTIQP